MDGDPNLPTDDRSLNAKAMSKVSEILACCLMMVIPALIGIWLDRTFSTMILFTLVGLVFGVTGAVLQLKRLISNPDKVTYDPTKIIKYEDDDEEDADDDWSEQDED